MINQLNSLLFDFVKYKLCLHYSINQSFIINKQHCIFHSCNRLWAYNKQYTHKHTHTIHN